MNEIIEKEMIDIRSMIYEIDGKEVMLDSDLAKLYHVETKRINEAVKNNPEKFPLRFNWVLSDDEKNILWSKFSTANISNMSRVNPRVFTEQGVYMLATVLKSKEVFLLAKKLMNLLKEIYNAESVYLCTMCDGPMNHFHLQLIPRYSFEKRGSKNFVKPRFYYKEDKDKLNELKNRMSK